MLHTANKELFMRFAEQAWNQGRLDVVDEVFAPDYIAHAQDPNHDIHGPEGHKAFIRDFRDAFPDVHIDMQHILIEDDLLVAHMSWSGTHTKDYNGIEATNRKISVTVIGINRFANGQVVEAWGVVDTLSMLQQLGVIPDGDDS